MPTQPAVGGQPTPTAPSVPASEIVYAATATLTPDTTCNKAAGAKTFTTSNSFYINACVNGGYGPGRILATLYYNGHATTITSYRDDHSGTSGGYYMPFGPQKVGNYVAVVTWNGYVAQRVSFTVQ